MKLSPFRVEALGREHDRGPFRSGDEAADRYLREEAMGEVRRGVANCFVALETGTEAVAGYYTLRAVSILVSGVARKDVPRYPTVRAVRIGRLAVDRGFQGRGLGGALVADAGARVVELAAGVSVLVVDAGDEGFYGRYGFRGVPGGVMVLGAFKGPPINADARR